MASTKQYYVRQTISTTMASTAGVPTPQTLSFGFVAREVVIANTTGGAASAQVYAQFDGETPTASSYPLPVGGTPLHLTNTPIDGVSLLLSTGSTGSALVDVFALQ